MYTFFDTEMILDLTLKARTHRPNSRGFAAESVVKLADSTTKFTIVGRLDLDLTLKACTHRPNSRGFAAESVVKLADSTTKLTIVGRLSLSNKFDMLLVLPVGQRESVDFCCRPNANWSSEYGPRYGPLRPVPTHLFLEIRHWNPPTRSYNRPILAPILAPIPQESVCRYWYKIIVGRFSIIVSRFSVDSADSPY